MDIDLKKLEDISRISVNEDKELIQQISKIVDYISDVSKVSGCKYNIETKENVFRDDIVKDCNGNEIDNMPEKEGRFLKVRQIL